MKVRRSLSLLFAILLTFSFALCLQAAAQPDFDRATEAVDVDVREKAAEKLRVPPPKPAEIDEEEEAEVPEGPKVFVKRIELVGIESFTPEDFSSITQKYENREVSLGELNILAKEIEREYLRRGIIAACFVVPQEIKDGVVTLRIVEAKMGALKIEDHKWYDKDRVAYWWSTKPGQVLRYDRMQRDLQLMNKTPDREVRATLAAGTKPETTDVILTADTKFPIHPFFSFDMEGIKYTGHERWGYGVKHNNVLLCDDTLLTGHSFGKDFNSFYIFHSIPITNIGGSLLYGYSDSNAWPMREYGQFDMATRAQNASIYFHQDLFRRGEYIGEVYTGFDSKDKNVKTNIGTTNKDRLRIVRFGGNFVMRHTGAITYIKPEYSQGLNILGARRKGDFTTRGADCVFSKFNLGVQHKRALPWWGMQTMLRAKGQYAGVKLVSQEQFSLGGIDSVRGYPAGDFLADHALQANAELLIPASFIPESVKLPYDKKPLRDEITGVAFLDFGWGYKRNKLPWEREDITMMGIGCGVRFRLYDRVLLRFEGGFPVAQDPVLENGPFRFHTSVNIEI